MAKIPLPATNPAPSPTPVPALVSQRLMSLDALRGFDMFWIIGGEDVLRAIANLSGSPTFQSHRYNATPNTPSGTVSRSTT